MPHSPGPAGRGGPSIGARQEQKKHGAHDVDVETNFRDEGQGLVLPRGNDGHLSLNNIRENFLEIIWGSGRCYIPLE